MDGCGGGGNTIHLTIPWCVSDTDSGFSLGGIRLLGVSVWGGDAEGGQSDREDGSVEGILQRVFRNIQKRSKQSSPA